MQDIQTNYVLTQGNPPPPPLTILPYNLHVFFCLWLLPLLFLYQKTHFSTMCTCVFNFMSYATQKLMRVLTHVLIKKFVYQKIDGVFLIFVLLFHLVLFSKNIWCFHILIKLILTIHPYFNYLFEIKFPSSLMKLYATAIYHHNYLTKFSFWIDTNQICLCHCCFFSHHITIDGNYRVITLFSLW